MGQKRVAEATEHEETRKRRRLVRKKELVRQQDNGNSEEESAIAAPVEAAPLPTPTASTSPSASQKPTLAGSVTTQPTDVTPPTSSPSGHASVVGASAVRGAKRKLVDEEDEGDEEEKPVGSELADPCSMNGAPANKRARTEAREQGEEEEQEAKGDEKEEPCNGAGRGETPVQPEAGSEEVKQPTSQAMTGGPSPPALKRKLEKILTDGGQAKDSHRQKRQRAAGFVNPRYRCFINASVHCLASLPEVKEYCLSRMGTGSPASWSGNISPSEGVSTPSLEGRRSRRNEVAHAERLQRALEKIEPENMDMSYEFANLVNDLYYETGSQSPPILRQGKEKAREKEDAKKIPAVDGVGFAAAFGRLHEGFDGNTQQDSMEFVTYLLTRMRQEEILHSQTPFIEEAFEGKMLHSMHCKHCDGTWDNEESFRDIGVNFPLEAALKSPVKPTRQKPSVHVTLDTCLDNAFEKQNMDTAAKCRLCGEAGGVDDTPSLTSLANNLIIQVKRFSTDFVTKKTRKGSRIEVVNRKINTVLNYGETLNLQQYFTKTDGTSPADDQTYELVGLVMHQGARPTQGHYLAYAQRAGQWHLFDDVKKVNPISFKDVLDNAAPYLMFWQKKKTVTAAQPNGTTS